MRILISTILSTKNKVGVTEYLIGLINALQEIDQNNKYYIITTKENRLFFNFKKENFHEIIINIYDLSRILLRFQYLIFTKFKLPRILKKYNIELIHEPSSWYINRKFRTVVTIHDVVELNNKKYSFLLNFIKQKIIFSSIYNASEIIAVSNATVEKIKNIYPRQIFKIYNGYTKLQVNSNNNQKNILNKYHLLRKKYMIFVGTLLQHKNILTLIEAFKISHISNQGFKLVLAGKKANATNGILKYIKNNKLEDSIVLTDYFDESEKYSLIYNAKALLLVSKEEGFGFPILEAQSLGIPVITSNTSSMKEVAQDSAIFISPDSSISISNAMKQIISSQIDIDNIITEGYRNIKQFSWIQTAKETIAVYRKAYLK